MAVVERQRIGGRRHASGRHLRGGVVEELGDQSPQALVALVLDQLVHQHVLHHLAAPAPAPAPAAPATGAGAGADGARGGGLAGRVGAAADEIERAQVASVKVVRDAHLARRVTVASKDLVGEAAVARRAAPAKDATGSVGAGLRRAEAPHAHRLLHLVSLAT